MKGKLIMTVEEAMADRSKWLEIRTKGIGGSDVSCVLGMNPWRSAYTLWAEKTGMAEPEDLSNNEFVYWGTVLEEAVANRFCEITGKKVRRCGTLADDEFDYMLANVDRLVVGEDAGLECKTANGFRAKEWDDDQLPDAYYLQCQWYMMITGCSKWYIACLIGGNHFVWKEIPRNDDDITKMREAVRVFWETNVMSRIPPVVDGSDSTTDLINEEYPNSADGLCVSLPSTAWALINRLDELMDTEKLVADEKSKCQNELKLMLGEAEKGTFQDRVITWKTQAGRVTVDSKKLKAERPDIFAAYSKTGNPTRVFKLK